MDVENESVAVGNPTLSQQSSSFKTDCIETNVKTLQSSLFPPQYSCTSYFSNFLLKTNQLEDEDDLRNRVKDSASRELLYSTKDAQTFATQLPRWPTECQVIEDRVKHISYTPSSPEPYYVTTGEEPQPKPTGDEYGVIVFQYNPISAVNYFCRSSVGGSKYLLSANLCPEEDGLCFESRFESGNLARAVRITPCYYELHVRSDLYTNKHMQWFYFRVSNTRKNFLYRFSIVNFSKESSLYNEGMKPVMYSVKDSQMHSIGWRRFGNNITYFSNDNVTADDPDQQMTYTLSFTVEFPHDNDEVYIAHCYPYTYSDLQDYLGELIAHPIKSNYATTRLLCKTLAGNNVYQVTITSPPVAGDIKKKKAVVISARVHPGETPASWMMKGILDFLTGDSAPAKELRDKFIFKLVPMLNPDGVIVGNSRCSLSAKDLNRQYRTVIREAYPSIWYTKLMVRRLLEECGVALYCDLHAHSRKHNIFIYGCENRKGSERHLQEQVFPLMLHKNTADKFSFESCTFKVQKAKEGTGRVVMWMMGIGNSYTMEASFAGSTLGNRCDSHFNPQDFENMGKSFCQTLLDFYDEDPKKEKLRVKIIDRLVKEGSSAVEPANIRLSDYSSDDGDTSSSSNEAGGDEEVIYPVVPPPSPSPAKKATKPSKSFTKQKAVLKSPAAGRKAIPISKTTLGLLLSEKVSSSSDSDSESEERKFRLLKKKSLVKKKSKEQVETKRQSSVSVSIYDILPSDKLRGNESKERASPKKVPLRHSPERRSQISKQLAQVQAKLFSLKNKIWYGCGDNAEAPLSWNKGTYGPNLTDTKNKKKLLKKKSSKGEKLDMKPKKGEKEKPKKSNTGLKRQNGIDWNGAEKLRKSKSFPDTSKHKLTIDKKDQSWDEETDSKEEKKLKKKRSKKFNKKAKADSDSVLVEDTDADADLLIVEMDDKNLVWKMNTGNTNNFCKKKTTRKKVIDHVKKLSKKSKRRKISLISFHKPKKNYNFRSKTVITSFLPHREPNCKKDLEGRVKFEVKIPSPKIEVLKETRNKKSEAEAKLLEIRSFQ